MISIARRPRRPRCWLKAATAGLASRRAARAERLTNVGAQNAITAGSWFARNELGSAKIVSGTGGDASQGNGGEGGSITGLKVGVQSHGYEGSVTAVYAGAGGNSTNGHGGAGGSIIKSTVASVDGDQILGFGVIVDAGRGGDGTLGGGSGGGIKKLTVNTPSEPNVYAAVVAAGNGGNATQSGAGGTGGNVKGISQSKDVNSAITAILGGSGGTSAGGTGGAGGSIKKIDTEGFIGLPANDTTNLGVFDAGISSPDIEALFAGGSRVAGSLCRARRGRGRQWLGPHRDGPADRGHRRGGGRRRIVRGGGRRHKNQCGPDRIRNQPGRDFRVNRRRYRLTVRGGPGGRFHPRRQRSAGSRPSTRRRTAAFTFNG